MELRLFRRRPPEAQPAASVDTERLDPLVQEEVDPPAGGPVDVRFRAELAGMGTHVQADRDELDPVEVLTLWAAVDRAAGMEMPDQLAETISTVDDAAGWWEVYDDRRRAELARRGPR